jgi:hypothetical protein
MVGWLLYIASVLAVSGLVGMHLRRFREAYTEMTGMMAGMTMGMLNGFALGFGAAAATNSMFWGNLFGILLGLWLGIYFGRSGGLMGVMDGGMGGVMGGSMGAMLALMVVSPAWAQLWTALLLMALYVLGIVGLVVLIERSAPGHAALHRLAPFFTRAMAQEAEEVAEEAGPARAGGAGMRVADSTTGGSTWMSAKMGNPQRANFSSFGSVRLRQPTPFQAREGCVNRPGSAIDSSHATLYTEPTSRLQVRL